MAAQDPDEDLKPFLKDFQKIAETLRLPEERPKPPTPLGKLTKEELLRQFAKEFQRTDTSKTQKQPLEGPGVNELFRRPQEGDEQRKIYDRIIRQLKLIYPAPETYLQRIQQGGGYSRSNIEMVNHLFNTFKNPAAVPHDPWLAKMLGLTPPAGSVEAEVAQKLEEKVPEEQAPEKESAKEESRKEPERPVTGKGGAATVAAVPIITSEPSTKIAETTLTPPQVTEAPKQAPRATPVSTIAETTLAPTIPPGAEMITKKPVTLPETQARRQVKGPILRRVVKQAQKVISQPPKLVRVIRERLQKPITTPLPPKPVVINPLPKVLKAKLAPKPYRTPAQIFSELWGKSGMAETIERIFSQEKTSTTGITPNEPRAIGSTPGPKTVYSPSSGNTGQIIHGASLARIRRTPQNQLALLVRRQALARARTPFALIIGGILVLILLFYYTFQNGILDPTALLSRNPIPICSNQGGGVGCPDQATLDANAQDPKTCKFLNPSIPLNGDLSQSQVQQFISIYQSQSKLSLDEFTAKTNEIVAKARSVQINPVILLATWKTEGGFTNNFGCGSNPGADSFETQLNCISGLDGNGNWTSGKGFVGSQCASPVNPNRQADCNTAQGLINKSNPENYYVSNPFPNANRTYNFPFSAFDDWEGLFGSHAPDLNGPGTTNNNCIWSYNQHIKIAESIGACGGGTSTNLASTSTGDISSCKFYKGDQGTTSCAPGKTCQVALPYITPKLIGYFNEVSAKTAIPASILAGIARIESTTATYTISDYTDSDITTIEADLASSNSQIVQNTKVLIPGTNKAMCPTSLTNALGIMQVEPAWETGSADTAGLRVGANFAGKSFDNLTVKDYCDPRTSVYLGAGVLLDKMKANGKGDGTKWLPDWNNQQDINLAGDSYYGGCHGNYPDCSGGPYNYGNDLWNSYSNCQASGLLAQTQTACYCSASGINNTITAGASFSIGNDAAGKEITAYQLGAGSNVVAIVGGMNGKAAEPAGVDMVNQAYAAFGQSNGTYQIPQNMTVYFIPEITPDSTGGGFNFAGQDVNRNFDSTVAGGAWNVLGCSAGRYKDAGGTAYSCSPSTNNGAQDANPIFGTFCNNPQSNKTGVFYCLNKTGQKAYDQPETQAVVNFLKSKGVQSVISYRAPYNDVTTSNAAQKLPKSDQLSQLMAGWLGIPYDKYFPNYPVTGQFMDYLQDQNITASEIELNQDPSPGSQFLTTNLDALQKALNWLGANGTTNLVNTCGPNLASFVYYCQGNSTDTANSPQGGNYSWKNYPYACENLGTAGCGPTSMAMVLSSFGTVMTPTQVSDIYTQRNWYACGSGSLMESAIQDKTWLPSLGFQADPPIITPELGPTGVHTGRNLLDMTQAQKYLNSGWLIIGSSPAFPCANCKSLSEVNHIFVVDSVNIADNTIDIRDPNNCSYADGNDENPNKRVHKVDEFPWNYAYPIKKVR